MNTQEMYQEEIERLITAFWAIPHLKSFDQEELERIKEAYLLAREAHAGQKRKTGEPYIIHPISVASIVAGEFQLGANPIIAAFLHDVVEDTPFDIEDIRSRFGDDVASLVGTVTKKEKEKYEMSKQLDNFKQMLDSIHYDIRALLVKLADRLHNMRTLSSMAPDKQMKIAGETDYFYAPLANRLGLYDVKTELENLSLKYRCPQEYNSIEQAINSYKQENDASFARWTGAIREHLAQNSIETKVEIHFLPVCSIRRRMNVSGSDFKHTVKKHFVLITFDDCGGMTEKNRCLQIYSLLTDFLKEMPCSLRNYIDSPKENGYQAIHLRVLDEKGEWEEVHIASERMMYNSRMGCISERAAGVSQWIAKFREVLKDIANHSNEGGFIEEVVSNFYNDDILVFTPKGNGVVLPKNATAIDFAYAIHSDIGEHAQYARINGKLCSIKTPLHRGDCVEIGTCERVMPKREWSALATTYNAKRHILSSLKREQSVELIEEPYRLCPHCHPLPGDEVIGFKDEKGNIMVHKRNCMEAIKEASKEGDSIIDVAFKSSSIVYPVTINIKAVDRFHLLIDLVHVITDELSLSIDSLTTTTTDEIVDCTIHFAIHSAGELEEAIHHINLIKGVDEVKRIVN